MLSLKDLFLNQKVEFSYSLDELKVFANQIEPRGLALLFVS